MQRGLVDFVISTGANLYHDLHYALNFTLSRGSPFVDDRVLYQEGVIRIYDVLFPAQVLLDTDAFTSNGMWTIITIPLNSTAATTGWVSHFIARYTRPSPIISRANQVGVFHLVRWLGPPRPPGDRRPPHRWGWFFQERHGIVVLASAFRKHLLGNEDIWLIQE